ncbi:hypothetical protein LCGC14_2436250, partial [marine sediment metagenome]
WTVLANYSDVANGTPFVRGIALNDTRGLTSAWNVTCFDGSFTWNTSTGTELPLRWYDDELEVYLGTVDGVVVDAWTRVANGLSTSAIPRAALWWDTAEDLDLLLWVENTDNILSWSGMVTTIASATSNTITKNGTDTWAQARAETAGTTIVTINGNDYTYTGGEGTTTLTGVTPNPSGEAADSVAIQTHVVNTNTPLADRNNDYIFEFENQIWIGADKANEVFVSSNSDFTDYTFSAPRLSGEGALLTLDGPTKGFSTLSKIPVIFSGESSIFTAEFQQIDVGGILSETLKVRRLKTGVNQGAFNQETIVSIGDSILYLTNENTLRMLETVDTADQPQLRSLSNPIKPDFDAANFTNGQVKVHGNRIYIVAPEDSNLWINERRINTSGVATRFWQPPQIMPLRRLSIIDELIHGHSSGFNETYKLFDGTRDGGDGTGDVGTPISFNASYAYRNYRDRGALKELDQWLTEGYIRGNTKITHQLRYEFEGAEQVLEKIIDGSDDKILFEIIAGLTPLGTTPLG